MDEHGLSTVRLIDADDAAPTEEAWDLADGFTGIGTSIEELLFQKLREQLDKQPAALANQYYTTIREFIIRNPIATRQDIFALGDEIPPPAWECVHPFYEPIPESWVTPEGVPHCAHCGNAMKRAPAGLVCRSSACSHGNGTRHGGYRPAADLMRVTRAIHQYWVEPGVDEIRLYDQLLATGKPAELYPFRDRVDIAVGEFGLDLKSYASPELLGTKIRKSKGGLAYYSRQLLVIPDWLVDMTPNYLERVTSAMEDASRSVCCVRASDAFREIAGA
ncbi:hypothetical protein TSA66_03290 [Noviherbaspirillum autotrophicum]|uniref:REase associating with pPIWI RE domain-containing protein n=1 Tax=Noviherbaspirillum autotrophicum TaxID=709839 RepID=A0A0C2BJ91_9BURK|nr:hypothetical protein TSA66_03290 [Noviherbaspirillum autotrophicum]